MSLKLGNADVSLYRGSQAVAAYLGDVQVSGSAFSPASIANLALWMEPSDAVVDDGEVTSWPAREGAFTATVQEGMPTYSATGVGGKPGVAFDGSAAMAIQSEVLAGDEEQSFTLFGVVKPTGPNNGPQSVRWLCLGGESVGNKISYLSMRPYASTPQFAAGVGMAQQSEVELTSGITEIENVVGLVCLSYNGSTQEAELFVNGESEDTDTITATGSYDGHVWIGDQPGEDFHLTGIVGDCLLYSRLLTPSERGQVFAYLTAKYL